MKKKENNIKKRKSQKTQKEKEEFKLALWDITKKIIGIILIILGIAGLFLPFLQGIILIAIGLAFLGNKRIKRILKKYWEKIKARKKKNKALTSEKTPTKIFKNPKNK